MSLDGEESQADKCLKDRGETINLLSVVVPDLHWAYKELTLAFVFFYNPKKIQQSPISLWDDWPSIFLGLNIENKSTVRLSSHREYRMFELAG